MALTLQEQISGIQESSGISVNDNPIWLDNPTADPSYTTDASVDVPGRPSQQSWFQWLFSGSSGSTPDMQQRDAGTSDPRIVKNISPKATAEGPGVLANLWNSVTHPMQTFEDASASTGSAVGKATANAMTPIIKAILPLIIIMAVVFLGSLFFISKSVSVNANV